MHGGHWWGGGGGEEDWPDVVQAGRQAGRWISEFVVVLRRNCNKFTGLERDV